MRTILHADMDAFFVSVELRRRPELQGRPVVVGGNGRRGVVAAASYEARRYGVFSAMPSAIARRRCPDAVFLPGDHALYATVSRDVRAIFERYTPLIEPLSLDEAFLDVTGARRLFGDGVAIGHRIRDDIATELELDCSVGVAANKFLAKLASVEAKPRFGPGGVRPGPGVFEIRRGGELDYLRPLPVQRLWGVGPKTVERLQRLGVETVADLVRLDRRLLVTALGERSADHLLALGAGRDDRPVETGRSAKSVSHEETFPTNKHTTEELDRELVRLADAVSQRLRRSDVGARTLSLKVRFDDGFRTITRSTTLAEPIDNAPAMIAVLRPVLAAIDVSAGVRLFGVGASTLGPMQQQLSLDMSAEADSGARPQADWGAATDALDHIRDRFGDGSIGPASAIERRRLRIVQGGNQQWGPNADGADRGTPEKNVPRSR